MVATREGLLQYRVAGPVGMCEPQAARARRGQQGHALAGAQRAAPPVQRLQRHLAEQLLVARPGNGHGVARSEEHTSELQSPCNLVCRLLLEKKKKNTRANATQQSEARLPSPTLPPPTELCTTPPTT